MLQNDRNDVLEQLISDRFDFDLDEQNAMNRTAIRILQDKGNEEGEGKHV